jgi:5-formyltetrahydrofolate cyclo-ligase
MSNESEDHNSLDKHALRKLIRAARAALPQAERQHQSALITTKILARHEIISAQVIHCYVSMATEVDTAHLVQALFAAGKRVIVPWLHEDGSMDASEFLAEDVAGVQELGRLRVPQPPVFRPVDPGCWEVVIVPLVAATTAGDRLGNGAGHYDRLLTTWPRPAIGIALSVQMVETLPTEPHDITLDAIISV